MEFPFVQESGARRNERIAVIGSGIAGCLTAHELASAGYDVDVIESLEEPMSGTSARPIQAHLGGLYSGSPATAKECLRSAIAFKQALPFGLNRQKAFFLVANKSEIPLDEYIASYASLADYYGGLPASQQVFGPAERFFRILNPGEHDFIKGVEGGITTQEPGLNMVRLRSVLLSKLGRLGVKITTGTTVTGAEAENGKFTLTMGKDDVTEQAAFDQVINAGGYRARLLDHELGDRTPYHLFLKSWSIVRNNDRPLPPFCVVRGGFIHYSGNDNGDLASIIASNDEGSYLDAIRYDHSSPNLPPEWLQIMHSGEVPDKEERQKRVIEYAYDEFLPNAQLEPIDLVPGVAVSFSPALQDRTKRGANQVAPGWQTVIPTKATNALELAREARDNALYHSAVRAA